MFPFVRNSVLCFGLLWSCPNFLRSVQMYRGLCYELLSLPLFALFAPPPPPSTFTDLCYQINMKRCDHVSRVLFHSSYEISSAVWKLLTSGYYCELQMSRNAFRLLQPIHFLRSVALGWCRRTRFIFFLQSKLIELQMIFSENANFFGQKVKRGHGKMAKKSQN